MFCVFLKRNLSATTRKNTGKGELQEEGYEPETHGARGETNASEQGSFRDWIQTRRRRHLPDDGLVMFLNSALPLSNTISLGNADEQAQIFSRYVN